MTTATDPFAAWSHWLQHVLAHGEEQAASREAPWFLLLDQLMHELEHSLAQTTDWQSVFATRVDEARQQAMALAQQLAEWPKTLEHWLTSLYASCQPQRHRQGDLAAGLFGLLEDWPALGPMTPQHEAWAEFQDALPEAQHTALTYSSALQGMMTDALGRWRDSILQSQDAAPSAQVLRAHWLDTLDTAWQALLTDPEHAQQLQALNHAMERLRAASHRISEPLLHALGLPSRADLQGTQRRLQELRRQQTNTVPTQEITQLRAEVAQLRADLAHLQQRMEQGDSDPS